jgi:cellulose synthase/poly-beta-1,6-N-acetylglucosamine synthase-like glycosyltransferase
MFDAVQIIQNIIYIISLYYVVFWLLVLLEGKELNSVKKLKGYPAVSLAIPAYNEEDNIVETLENVVGLDYPKEKLSIIVIDDGSRDRTLERAREYAAEMRKKHNFRSFVVLTQKNKGKFAALNNALKRVDTEYFATLDADSIPRPDALKKIMACFEEGVGAVSPVLKVYKPKNTLQMMQWFEYSVNHFYKSVIAKLDAIHVTPGPLSVYRTDVVKSLRGFREAHKTEDMEVAMRIQKENFRIVQCNDAFVYTKAPARLRELYRQRHRWSYGTFKNLLDYRSMIFNREYGDFGLFQLPVILISGFLGITVLGLIMHNIWKALKPQFQILQMYGFDIIKYISNTRWNIIWLDIDMRAAVTVFSFILITLFVVWLSLRLYKDKYLFKKTFSFLLYLFFYYILLAVVWLGVFKDMIFRRGTSWKK